VTITGNLVKIFLVFNRKIHGRNLGVIKLDFHHIRNGAIFRINAQGHRWISRKKPPDIQV
jgi:hypothetical protein